MYNTPLQVVDKNSVLSIRTYLFIFQKKTGMLFECLKLDGWNGNGYDDVIFT